MPSPFDSLFTPPNLVGAGAPPAPAGGGSPFDRLPSVATPPFVSPTPAPTPAPPMPSFGQPPQAPGQKSPNFLSMALPILASTLIGRKDPRAIAEGLAGFMQGRELKRRERESAQQTAERKQAEQADFYSRALTQAQTIDDPVAFEQWKHAIAPVAQLHGVDANVFTFNDSKRLAREKKDAGELLATLDKQHPDGNYTAQWKGRHVTRAELAAFAGQAAFDDKGAPLAPGSTTNAQRFVASVRNADGTTSKVYAFEDPKTRKVTDATGKDITALILPPENADKRGFTPKTVTVNGKKVLANFDGDTGKYYDTQAGALLTGDVQDYEKPTNEPRGRFNIQQVTKQDGSTGLVRVNMDTGEVSPVALPDGAGAGHASDTQRLSKAYLDRTVASDKTAATFEASLAKLGSQLDVQLPNLLKSEQGQQYKQAEDEFINAALRRESGAAIQPSEYDRFEKIYFVRPGDTPATIRQKQQARTRVVSGFRVAAGNMGGAATTGPKIGERRTISGKLGEWDGKGWKAVAR